MKESDVSSYPRVAFLVTLLHCLYVITWYLQLGSRKEYLAAIRFEFLLAGGLIFILLFYLPVTRPSPHQRQILRCMWLFILCLLVSVFFSYDFPRSWQVFVDRLVKFSFMGIFVIAFVRGPLQLKFFLVAFMLACLKIEQEGIYGILTGSMLWESQGVQRLHGTTGLYAHPNSLAGLAIGTLPFVYYFYGVVSRPAMKAILGMQGGLAIMTIIYTGSRTAYVGLMFVLFFLVKDSRFKFKVMSALLVVVLCLLYSVPTEYWTRFESIFTGQEIEGSSLDSRKAIILEAIDVLIRHPFGVGVAAFPTMRNMYFGGTQDTHNLYLEVATNLGIQGLVAFLLFIYAMIKGLSYLRTNVAGQLASLTKMQTKEAPPAYKQHVNDLKLMKATADAVWLFLLIRLVIGLFGHDLYEVYWWFVLGLTVALLNMNVWANDRTKHIVSEEEEVGQVTPLIPVFDRRYPGAVKS